MCLRPLRMSSLFLYCRETTLPRKPKFSQTAPRGSLKERAIGRNVDGKKKKSKCYVTAGRFARELNRSEEPKRTFQVGEGGILIFKSIDITSASLLKISRLMLLGWFGPLQLAVMIKMMIIIISNGQNGLFVSTE